ncbi:MAG TPA: tetratricopeptide repeat protein [Nitrospiraceae bacterium]
MRSMFGSRFLLCLVCSALAAAPVLAPSAGRAQVTLPSESYDLNFAKGQAEYGADRYDEAARYFRKALEAKPGDPEAGYYLGQSLTRAKQFDEAEAVFRTLLDADPSSGRAHLGLAVVFYGQERFRDALASLAEAQKALPNDPLVYYYRGLTHYRLAEYEQMQPPMARALALGPDLATSAHYYSGLGYFQAGALEDAKGEFESAKQLAPESEFGRSAGEYLEQIKTGRPPTKKIWNLTLSVSSQWDDNVVALPSGTSPPAGATGISRKSDYFTAFYLRGDVRAFEKGPLAAGANYSFYQSLHRTLSGFDVESHTPTLFLQYTKGPVQARLQYILDYAQVGRSPYLVAHSFAPLITVTEAPNLFTQIQLRYQDQDFQHGRFLFNSQRDARNWLIGATQYWYFAKNTAHVRGGYTFDKNATGGGNVALATQASAADWSYDGHRFQIASTLPPWRKITVDAALDYYYQDYRNANSFSPNGAVFRKDQVYTYSLTVSRPLMEHVSVAFQYIHMYEDSNVAAFNFRRNIFGLSLTGQF